VTEPFSRPVPLTKDHDASAFDCGKEPLNEFLKKYALHNQLGGGSRTYVILGDHQNVIAYYSVTPGSVLREEAPERVSKRQPNYPIPVILMARFAVDKAYQGKGLGRSLFLDVLRRALNASDSIGGRAFLVHTKDEEAKAFYTKFGMMESPKHTMHLYLLFKDVRKYLPAEKYL
jgi:GNAT superfamily N-acetyltransferase